MLCVGRAVSHSCPFGASTSNPFALWARLRLRAAAEERLQKFPGDETLVIVRTTDHLNSDGVVNVLDLIILLLNFG